MSKPEINIALSVANAGFGGHLECNICHRKKKLGEIWPYLRGGWPKCHGYTMTWITARQEKEQS
jgi:hypothetical protein